MPARLHDDRFTLTVHDRIHIHAPLDRLWVLSTSVPLVQRTLGFTPVAGVTTGHVFAGSQVLWRGWLFGLPQHHLTRITGFQPPHAAPDGTRRAWFQDSQERGRFARFHHDHHLLATADGGTELIDVIHFRLPLGPAGYLVAGGLLEPFIRRILRRRLLLLRQVATSRAEWQRYL